MRLAHLAVLTLVTSLIACGDKESTASDDTATTGTTDDTGSAADDTGGDSSEVPEFADKPVDGALVADMRTTDGETRLVCGSASKLGLTTESTWIFNVLTEGDNCAYEGGTGAGLLAVNNMPTTDLSAYPGGSAQVEMDTGNLATRLYGHEALVFDQKVVSWDSAGRALQAVLYVKWAEGEVTIWVDAQFN